MGHCDNSVETGKMGFPFPDIRKPSEEQLWERHMPPILYSVQRVEMPIFSPRRKRQPFLSF